MTKNTFHTAHPFSSFYARLKHCYAPHFTITMLPCQSLFPFIVNICFSSGNTKAAKAKCLRRYAKSKTDRPVISRQSYARKIPISSFQQRPNITEIPAASAWGSLLSQHQLHCSIVRLLCQWGKKQISHRFVFPLLCSEYTKLISLASLTAILFGIFSNFCLLPVSRSAPPHFLQAPCFVRREIG